MTKVVDLLSDPDKWCRGCEAVDSDGQAVSAKDAYACSWCLLGALVVCYDDVNERNKAAEKIAAATNSPMCSEFDTVNFRIMLFNDSGVNSHADLMKVLKEADV